MVRGGTRADKLNDKGSNQMNGAGKDIPPVPKWLEPALQDYILLVDEEENDAAEFGLGFI